LFVQTIGPLPLILLSEHGISLLIWIIVFTVVCTIVLFLRFWAARVQKRLFYPDDFMVVFAYVSVASIAYL